MDKACEQPPRKMAELLDCVPNRQPLTANRFHPIQTKDPGEPGSCSSL
jgi:hypothetical protein